MGKLKTMVAAVSAIATLCTSLVLPTVNAQAEETSVNNGWSIEYLNNAKQDETHYAEITNKESHSGDYSLHINYPDGITEEDNGIKIRISHQAGYPFGEWDAANQFRVQFYIKGGYDKWCTQLGTFDCQDNSPNGTLMRISESKVTIEEPDENGWAKGYFDFYYPYGNDKSDFKINIFGSTNDVYIDDVSVTYSGTNSNRAETSLLFGGGFEPVEDLSKYDWSYTDGSGRAAAEIVNDGGNKMLHIRYAQEGYDDYFVLHKNIATPSGEEGINWNKYIIYFKAKGNFNSDYIEMGNDQYDNLLAKPTLVKELDDGWKLYSVKTGGQNNTGFRVKVHGYCYDMYLDDFAVVKLENDNETNGDHLFNGTFDNPAAKVAIQPSDWIIVENTLGDENFIVTRDDAHTYTGKNAMYIGTPGKWVDLKYADVRQNLPSDFDYSKNYTLKVKAYTPNVNTALSVMFSNMENGVASQLPINGTYAKHLGDSWYEYTVPMTAAEGYGQISFRYTLTTRRIF